MNMKFNAASGVKVATVCGLALGVGLLSFHARADEWNKKTIITLNEPTQISETYLEPGQYVLKLVDSPSNRNIVQIFDADERHVINTILAIPNYRLTPTGHSSFLFWETPAGSAKALRAWFYPGDNYGQEFPYPKQLRQIAYNAPLPAPAPEPPPLVAPAPEPAPVTTEAAPPEPTPEPEAAAPPPVETAPQAPEPQAQPEPAPPPPAELPTTATPYPLIGLGGLISLGLFVLLRATRVA